jgi:biopolymer transport protein ExbB/TolQ
MLGSKKRIESSFGMSLLPAAVIGTGGCGLFYFLITRPGLRSDLLLRYALCHWVAVASAWLFFMAAVVLAQKWMAARRQMRLAVEARSVLVELVEHRSLLENKALLNGVQRAEGLETLWRAQKRSLIECWFGQRVTNLIDRQIKRRSTKRLDEDLRELADRDADAQHSSYAMVRINCWAMPMLGFLGTVIGISDTLGQMDAQALASGSQDAMNSLTSGLYVAFDTTAVGLVLTMIAMFLQFTIQRSEMRLLEIIDEGVNGSIHQCLSQADEPTDTREVEASLRAIASKLMESMDQIVRKQSELWRETISGAHEHWLRINQGSSDAVLIGIRQAVADALDGHRVAMHEDLEGLSQLQSEGASQIDARLQQWQTTISEQARVSLRHQQELSRQTETLERLLQSSQLISAMQQPIESSLEKLTDIDRFQEAAMGLSEAVLVLSAQMEHLGNSSRQSVRRRSPESTKNASPAIPSEPAASVLPDDAAPMIIAIEDRVVGSYRTSSQRKRKAG